MYHPETDGIRSRDSQTSTTLSSGILAEERREGLYEHVRFKSMIGKAKKTIDPNSWELSN